MGDGRDYQKLGRGRGEGRGEEIRVTMKHESSVKLCTPLKLSNLISNVS